VKTTTLAYFVSSISLACVSLQAAPKLIHSSDLLNAHVYKLDNGLTVYLSKNSQSPNVYAEIAVRCGSYHDPKHATGLSHYLEHLMFKGSKSIGTTDFAKEKVHLDKITELYEKHKLETDPEKRKEIYKEINAESKLSAKFAIANDLDRMYKKIGGSGVNAHCSKEETVYKVNVPSNQIENWARIESERFSNPIFRLFHTELETVYEEKNRALDTDSRLVFNTIQNNLYPNHPYGESTLGKTEHLKNPSIKDIYSHFNTYYVPNNMAVIIAGDIEIDNTLKLIDTHFSSLKPKPLPNVKPHKLETIKGVKRVTVEFESDESVVMAWRTTPTQHPDTAALRMLDMILDNQVAGLINLNLSQAQKVRSAGSYPYTLSQAGAQYLYAYPREGQSLDELETLLLEQLQLVKDGAFEDWILPAIRTTLKINDEKSAESNTERVETMRDSFIANETWNYTVQEQARYAKVTKEDIVRVANKYFKDDYVVVRLTKGNPL